jgi:Ca2+-binding EF-hand superfamily protein
VDINIVNNLRAYRGVSPLKKAVMNILIKMVDGKDIERLREVFIAIDKEGIGNIKPHELKAAMKEANIEFDEAEVNRIMDEIDYDHEGYINYTEFLAAAIGVQKIITEEKMKAIF